MSEHIELAGHEGDVVLVNGICYAFTEYTAPVVIPCNDCDPPLAQAYTITLSGLNNTGAGWSVGNGTYTATWGGRPSNYEDRENNCDWLDSGFSVMLARDSGIGNNWEVSFRLYTLDPDASFFDEMRWENGPSDLCNPVGDYGTKTWCSPSCTGTNSCIVTAVDVTSSFNTCEECAS